MRLLRAAAEMPRDRLAELVSAAGYGSVLALAALTVVGISEVALGHGSELVAGVGIATWLAHLYAELLGDHIHRPQPLNRREIGRAAVDGSPILVSTVLPASVLLLGRLDVLADSTARTLAILVALVQLLSIGVVVARVGPTQPAATWRFAAAVAGVGLTVVALIVLLGH
jgi:hypothetical protein